MQEKMLECRNLFKSYDEGLKRVDVLKGVQFTVLAGKKIAIVGASGSGKSTLLNVLGGLDKPSAGDVLVQGKDFSRLKDNERGFIRNRYLGFVYQFHHLLPEFTALENVMMPLLIGKQSRDQAAKQAEKLLQRVGMSHRLSHKPSELSGGERQRVAIARALVAEPGVVLLDEPTGNLDKENAQNIHALLDELSTSLKTSFVVVTHDEHFASSLDEVFLLEDGSLQEVKK